MTWNEHVSAALLGTERRPPPDFPGASGDDPAGRLLDQAAVLTVRRRAGQKAVTGVEPIAPAPQESAPSVPAAAAGRLARILGGERVRTLPEWLNAVADLGYRVPSRLLPELLEKGRGDRSLRPAIARAAGRRGVWLALQNTDWAYLVSSGDDPGGDAEVWETGTRQQRVAYITRLRGIDPKAAREALLATWSRESATDRVALLATFSHGLGAGDEEFLENALGDRGKDVRQLASDLLARLPGSAYGQRMAERALRCVRPETRRRRGRAETWLMVEPPATHDEDLARDGIPFHPSGSFAPGARTIGTRAAWLREILARAPLSTWTELLDLPPLEIVALPTGTAGEADGRSARDLHTGWARAAASQHDVDWARALLKGGVLVDEPEPLAELLTVLPADEREATAADLIKWGESGPDLLRVLQEVPGPWRGPLADAVIATITDLLDVSSGVKFRAMQELCELAERRLSPDTAPRLERHAPSEDQWVLTQLINSLNFRHEMLKELSQ